MIKLGLIGKNIQHSLSPSIYKKIYGPKISYDLLDFQNEDSIPNVEKLFETYSGINITSPYKTVFLKQVELTDNAKQLGAINCLKKENGIIIGENTDYLAIVEILNRWLLNYKFTEVAVLGDGVMAGVTTEALKKLNLKFKIFSRKKTPDFNSLDLKSVLNLHENDSLLVINTCSRDYTFSGSLPLNTIFWDYNYNFTPHNSLKQKVKLYCDGQEMLELQAQYAVAFWSLIQK
jgi:shikimate dehydrogenase